MSSCSVTRLEFDALAAGGDLSDAAALHVDACAGCRYDFDKRFPPAPPFQASSSRTLRWPLVAAAVAMFAMTAALAAGWFARDDAESHLVGLEGLPPAESLAGTVWLNGSGSLEFADVTLVVFWEAWCPHCPDGLIDAEELTRAYAADGLDVVGVTTLSKGVTEQEARDLVERLDLSFPNAVDRQRVVADRFGVRAWPRAYLVAGGQIVWEGHPRNVDQGELRRLLR
jgi:thiol-disulfide isomerase/thioredoxin